MKLLINYFFILLLFTGFLHSMEDPTNIFQQKMIEMQTAAHQQALANISEAAKPLIQQHIKTCKPLTDLYTQHYPKLPQPELLGILNAAFLTIRLQTFKQGVKHTLNILTNPPSKSNDKLVQRCETVRKVIKQQAHNELYDAMKIYDKDGKLSNLPEDKRENIEHALMYYRSSYEERQLKQLIDFEIKSNNNVLEDTRDTIYEKMKAKKEQEKYFFQKSFFTYPLFTACVFGVYKIAKIYLNVQLLTDFASDYVEKFCAET